MVNKYDASLNIDRFRHLDSVYHITVVAILYWLIQVPSQFLHHFTFSKPKAHWTLTMHILSL